MNDRVVLPAILTTAIKQLLRLVPRGEAVLRHPSCLSRQDVINLGAAADQVEAALRRYTTNPLLVTVNPGYGYGFDDDDDNPHTRSHVRGAKWPRAMADAVYEIKYRHVDDGKDYVHSFNRPSNVLITAESPIRVVLTSARPIIGMF